jgi:NADH-quinone oxidoreductase subunit M
VLEANILSIITFLPLAGAMVLLLLPNTESYRGAFRWGAFGVAMLAFLASLYLLAAFDASAGLQLAISLPWIPQWGASFSLAVDGISLWLVLLNTLLFPLAILSSIGVITKEEKKFYILLLLLETAVTGVFLAQDLLLFYFFWEAVLIPMYFLIGLWGGKQRLYATTKFVLYTMAGSLLMLAAIIAVHMFSSLSGLFEQPTFDFAKLAQLHYPPQFELWCFLAFALAFAIKVPLFPFHTWLPDAHTEAPTAGSIILAGVLLKMGTYGFIRIAIPLFHDACFYPLNLGGMSFTPSDVIMALAVAGIIYGALVAAVQVDVKRLVAYSSVAHLGFVMLGLFSFSQQAVDGAVLQMVNHGISTGALFMLVGYIYDRRHTRLITEFGGLARVMPVYYNLFLIIMLSSMGLPALNGFVGEFLILIGSFQVNWLLTIIATLGVILAAVYLLYMFRRVFFGEVRHAENRTLKDLCLRELLAVLPLVVLAFILGVFPMPFLGRISPATEPVVETMRQTSESMEVDYLSRGGPALDTEGQLAGIAGGRM